MQSRCTAILRSYADFSILSKLVGLAAFPIFLRVLCDADSTPNHISFAPACAAILSTDGVSFLSGFVRKDHDILSPVD